MFFQVPTSSSPNPHTRADSNIAKKLARNRYQNFDSTKTSTFSLEKERKISPFINNKSALIKSSNEYDKINSVLNQVLNG
tara:strand:- start:121 stop:360 length:240 start_codon:yes stop_codon:yes gene_type:complete